MKGTYKYNTISNNVFYNYEKILGTNDLQTCKITGNKIKDMSNFLENFYGVIFSPKLNIYSIQSLIIL